MGYRSGSAQGAWAAASDQLSACEGGVRQVGGGEGAGGECDGRCGGQRQRSEGGN
jgi:hypothetical protein